MNITKKRQRQQQFKKDIEAACKEDNVLNFLELKPHILAMSKNDKSYLMFECFKTSCSYGGQKIIDTLFNDKELGFLKIQEWIQYGAVMCVLENQSAVLHYLLDSAKYDWPGSRENPYPYTDMCYQVLRKAIARNRNKEWDFLINQMHKCIEVELKEKPHILEQDNYETFKLALDNQNTHAIKSFISIYTLTGEELELKELLPDSFLNNNEEIQELFKINREKNSLTREIKAPLNKNTQNFKI